MYTVKHINVLGYKRWHVQSKCLLDSDTISGEVSMRTDRMARKIVM